MRELFTTRFTWMTAMLLLTSTLAWAQSKVVTGKITSAEDGASLPGVNVLEKGTSNGTVTDSNGHYSISVTDNATLIFSFIGYKSQEVIVGGQSAVDLTLQVDVTSLSEVVVVGYGQQEKKDVTGVVATVDSKSFNKGAIVSPDQLMNGKVAGVQILPSDGQPGSGSSIRIRGGTSINASNEPLYVVDGIPVVSDGTAAGRNPLNFINTNDIETFTVLKDASAAAIYGSRAANGVILITTKRGKSGAPTLSYDGFVSVGTVAKKYDVFNADQFRSVVSYYAPQNLKYMGNPEAADVADRAYNTNWQDQIFQTAVGQSHNLSLSGGTDKTNYRVSLGHLQQDGIIKTSYTKKTNIGVNFSQLALDDALKIDVNVKGAVTEDFYSADVIGAAISYDPSHPVYDAKSPFGGYYEYYDSIGGKRVPKVNSPNNPVSSLMQSKDVGSVLRSLGNLQLDYKVKVVPGLRFNVNLGYDVTRGQRKQFLPSTLKAENSPDTGKVVIQNPYKNSMLFEGYINYTRDLKSIKSKVDVTGGYSWQSFYAENHGYTATQLSTNIYGYNNPGVARKTIPFDPLSTTAIPSLGENRLISFFGRVNYSYDERFLLTVNLRRDGSTRFGPNNKWGTFPSAAIGWRIANENFMQNQNIFSDLKLRAGYGITGNQDIGNFRYLGTYTPSDPQANYQFGSAYYTTIRPSGYDTNLQWEQTASSNIGLDFGVLQGRLSGSIEVYQKNTDKLLFTRAVAPGANLTNTILTNIGKVQNKGVELSLDAVAISTPSLTWNVGFNAAYNTNKITQLDGNNDPDFPGYAAGDNIAGGVGNKVEILRVGQPVNAFYVFEHKTGADGKPVNDNLGAEDKTNMYVDQNNDGIINEKDLRPFHRPAPRVLMGLTSQLNYKNFDFSFTLRANLGNYVYNNVASNSTFQRAGDAFRPLNLITNSLRANYYTPQYFSDFYVENASFLRMDNLTLGYSVKQLTKANIRVYATVQNAFVITKYSGIDPEVSVSGIDNNLYPRARTFVFGVHIGL
ncbi:iron complex outermembrane recepter protein [Chryseolinea serpens]|uniref:Iron complex outermembrane recepter protein n=1 Tax=Chryseolinea serpens TaxID=947013 RepID=A0A1M5KW18_9BACT|nr:TonB-dependent receptor [Chryseolinea serpens]SHG56937.1 iron complex outermembrane recepter protein [Chryseolinea serpens]